MIKNIIVLLIITGVEVTQEIMIVIAVLPVTARVEAAQEIMSEEEKIYDTKKSNMIKNGEL
jgi:hypothetical protein